MTKVKLAYTYSTRVLSSTQNIPLVTYRRTTAVRCRATLIVICIAVFRTGVYRLCNFKHIYHICRVQGYRYSCVL